MTFLLTVAVIAVVISLTILAICCRLFRRADLQRTSAIIATTLGVPAVWIAVLVFAFDDDSSAGLGLGMLSFIAVPVFWLVSIPSTLLAREAVSRVVSPNSTD